MRITLLEAPADASARTRTPRCGVVRKAVTGVARTGDADAGAGADGVRSEADASEKVRPRSVVTPVRGLECYEVDTNLADACGAARRNNLRPSGARAGSAGSGCDRRPPRVLHSKNRLSGQET